MGWLASWRGRHPDWYVLFAWMLAWMLGLVAAAVLLALVAVVWFVLRVVDLAPGRNLFLIFSEAALAFGFSVPQYIALRSIVRSDSGAAKAWVPVTVFLVVAQSVIAMLWFSASPGPATTIFGFACLGVFGLAQGLLLSEMLGRRSAAAVWLGAMVAFVALGYVRPGAGVEGALSGQNLVISVMIDGSTVGGLYGALTGVVLVFLVRWSTRVPAPEPTL